MIGCVSEEWVKRNPKIWEDLKDEWREYTPVKEEDNPKEKKLRDSLDDSYIKILLRKYTLNVIPQEIIKFKRAIILAKRELRSYKWKQQ